MDFVGNSAETRRSSRLCGEWDVCVYGRQGVLPKSERNGDGYITFTAEPPSAPGFR